MAYHIVLTDLDTGETIHDNETDAVVVIFDAGETVTRTRRINADCNTIAGLAQFLLFEYNEMMEHLPKGLRKFAQKVIRKKAKKRLKEYRQTLKK